MISNPYVQGKELPCEIRGTPEVDVLVAIAIDLDDLILILQGKDFLSVINGSESEGDERFLVAEGKRNGGKLVLFNLIETAILYDLLNALQLLQMMSLETCIELNINSSNIRIPFFTRRNLCV